MKFNGLKIAGTNNFRLGVIFILFGLIYCDVSLLNHYLFRSTSMDLGIYNHAIYQYSHFHFSSYVMEGVKFSNILSDHFELYPILLSPLYWIFGSYTLLLAQVAIILLAGMGIYRYIHLKTGSAFYARIALCHFFCIWGIYSALSFDFHNNVIATMLIPWLFYYFERRKFKIAGLFLVLIMVGKENMALWAVFIGLGLAILNYKEKRKALFAIGMSVTALLYFVIIIKVVMPLMADGGRGYSHFQFAALGTDFGEALHTIFFRPGYAISLLFSNPIHDPEYNGIKVRTHLFILLSGGIIFLYRPQYLLMLLPVYGQKMFNDDPGKWGLYWQYSIEFAPILTIALFTGLYDLLLYRPSMLKKIAAASVVLAFGVMVLAMEYQLKNPFFSSSYRFYGKSHYIKDELLCDEYNAMEMIPENAVVSAQSVLVPHLAARDSIYEYPYGKWADYIVMRETSGGTVCDTKLLNSLRQLYTHSDNYRIVYQNKKMIIAHKIL